ncbi:MAG TPA: hypothetical protein VMZ53_11215 [Kofleriaceae bacterium]|nr:hypothetical protein [Kofleriaceae bacterium]
MRHHLAKLTPVLLGGCSLLYNPNNISKPPVDATDGPLEIDAAPMIDGAIDAPPNYTVDPTMLTVIDAWPHDIYEGQGLDNSSPVNLVIYGHHFAPDATVAINPSAGLTVGTPTISANHDYIVVPITAAVSATDTGSAALTITVSETGATPFDLSGKVSLQYLKSLTNGTLTLPLDTRYARVALPATVTFAGDLASPVRIHSMSSITCGNGTTNGFAAKGGTATNTTGAAGGPGGCSGGNEGAAGGCGAPLIGGGGSTSGANGGGGGGHGTAGTSGGGNNGGAAHGSPLLLTFTGAAADGSDYNQASGGGGGTADGLILASGGGGGGGGGGSVEMVAGGDIKCGAIDVSGGKGADGAGTLGGTGGGGGGAGGALIVRTGRGTIMNASLLASGGGGGAKQGTGSNGGAGGVGRVRVDTAGALPTVTPGAALHRGLSFASSTMPFYTVPNPMVTLLGTAGDSFDMYVVDDAGVAHEGEPKNQMIGTTGMTTLQVTLLPGYNRLCATIKPGVRDKDNAFSLADTCIEIAYLP